MGSRVIGGCKGGACTMIRAAKVRIQKKRKKKEKKGPKGEKERRKKEHVDSKSSHEMIKMLTMSLNKPVCRQYDF